MKKAISPMVATVLLIGFTIAVGAILSVWFTSFTRTQTAGVQAGAACATNRIDVRGIGFDSSNNLTMMVLNSGPDDVNVTSVIVTCGGVVKNNTPNLNLIVKANNQTTTTIIGTSGCTNSNLGISLVAQCSKGGTTQAVCPEGTCFW
jgi:flagellin-like protein